MATLTQEKVQEIVTNYGANEKDSGSPHVQIALLTQRILDVTEHMKKHKKDVHTRRGLTTMVAKRRRLLNYLMSRDLEGYRALIKRLELRR